MLSVAALNTAAVATPAAIRGVFSPSKHPFMKRVLAAPTHFSFDPYKMARAKLMMATNAATMTAAACTSPSMAAIAAMKKAVVAAAAAASPVKKAPIAVRIAEEKEIVVAAATKTAAPTTAANFRVACIAFKQGSCNYRAPFRVVEGDVVVVEGDRGEHIGTIRSVFPAADTESMAASVTGKILRRATAADLEALSTKSTKEVSVHEEVSKIAKDLKLNATIADVEFQFDNNKLTIFVERASSSTFVDFRKVQRTLFKMFHCRIWFVYMDELSN